jgi:hypothetical protein
LRASSGTTRQKIAGSYVPGKPTKTVAEVAIEYEYEYRDAEYEYETNPET